MSDDGSELFKSERFRYSRERLIEEAEKYVAEANSKLTTYEAAVKAYNDAVREYALNNYTNYPPRVNISGYRGIEVEFNVPTPDNFEAILGVSMPERPKVNKQAADEIEKALKIVKLGSGEYVPAKMAETITKWLIQ